MEATALRFMRAWPEVPNDLRPVYSWFFDAGLIWIDPQAEATGAFPSQLRLTESGQLIKDLVDGQSFNFFRIPDVLALEQTKYIVMKAEPIKHLLKIFQTDWRNPDIKLYCDLRKKDQPIPECGLKTALTALGLAVDALNSQIERTLWEAGFDEEFIPF